MRTHQPTPCRSRLPGFTLIELLVVIAIIAILAAMLLPALASAKARAQRLQCASGMKQLALGLNLFTTDHTDHYPPAGWSFGPDASATIQLSWDSWINNYVGGNNSQADMQLGYILGGAGGAPKVLVCPADQFPKVDWMGGTFPDFSQRSYAMNGAGPAWSTQYQVADAGRTYPLPRIQNGPGIYWVDTLEPFADWDARGYATSAVKDSTGTILLAENTHGQQCAGNIWTCIVLGPESTTPNDLYQMDPNMNPQDPTSGTSVNEGRALYKAHRNRFNYAFCDGHVEALKVEQTIGTGTLTAPNGMWSEVPGD
jgi:prepilin-type N-terminal cleavage/methylation domain-containing protein/prepilin-type processing-associated H-X9-DG protein